MNSPAMPPPDIPDPTSTLDDAGLYRALAESDGLGGFLQELSERATRAVDPCACSVTLRRADRLHTVASSDGLISGLDEVQYEADTGPCVTAARESVEQHAPDLAAEPRWAPFSTAARSRGIRSLLAVPLALDHGGYGALNFYARDPDAFHGHRETARELAAQASGAIAVALRIEHEREAGLDLRTAMLSRSVIDQAIGILMAWHRCDGPTALGLLRRRSQDENVKLSTLCEQLVTLVGGGPPDDGGFTKRPRA